MIAFTLIGIGSIVYAVTAYAGYRAVHELTAHANARHEAMETLLIVERTIGSLVDLETGQRGFMLSGREEFLEPFDEARSQLQQLYPKLQERLTASHSNGVAALVPVIDRLVEQRLAAAESAVETRRRFGADPIREMTEHQYGRQLMDALRARFATLEAFQSAEVDRRSRESDQLGRVTSTVVAVLTAGGTLLMAVALWVMRYERRERDRADLRVTRATERLESQVVERTSALSGAMAQIQSFTVELDLRIEAERKRLSREVHDQLGQIATAAKMVVKDLGRAHPEVPAASIDQLSDLLDEAILTSRRIAAELRPPMLDDLGLSAAVEHHMSAIASVGHLVTAVDIQDDHTLTAAQSNQLFRILQEACTNVLRHANATSVLVRGAVEGEQYRFEVHDDGCGPKAARPGASGLRNMKERAALVGGTLQFHSRAEGGTAVTIQLPIRETVS